MTHSPFDLHDALREGTPVVPLLSRRCMVGGSGGQVFSGEPGVVVRRASDIYGTLMVRFGNGATVRYLPHEVAAIDQSVCPYDLRSGIVLTTRIGSRAHGIARPDSDDDLRGVFVAPPDLHWSIMATPRRVEYLRSGLDELYYEIEGFVRRLLTGDPMAIETLFSHDVVSANAVGEYLLARKQEFLTRPALLGFPTFLRSAARKLHTQHRRGKAVKPKALMHWLRLALSALRAIQSGELTLEAREYAPMLIEIRDGKWTYERVFEEVFKTLRQIRDALDHSPLPARAALRTADEVLIFARAEAAKSWLASHDRRVSVTEAYAAAAAEQRREALAHADPKWDALDREVWQAREVVFTRDAPAAATNGAASRNGHVAEAAEAPGTGNGKSRRRRRRRGRSKLAAPLAAIDQANHEAGSDDDGERDERHGGDEEHGREDLGGHEHPDGAGTVDELLSEATEFARRADGPRRTFMVMTEGENLPARVVFVSSEGNEALSGDDCGEAAVENACGWKEGPGRSPSRKARKRRGDWEDDEDWNEGTTGEGEEPDEDEDDGEGGAPEPQPAPAHRLPAKARGARRFNRGQRGANGHVDRNLPDQPSP